MLKSLCYIKLEHIHTLIEKFTSRISWWYLQLKHKLQQINIDQMTLPYQVFLSISVHHIYVICPKYVTSLFFFPHNLFEILKLWFISSTVKHSTGQKVGTHPILSFGETKHWFHTCPWCSCPKEHLKWKKQRNIKGNYPQTTSHTKETGIVQGGNYSDWELSQEEIARIGNCPGENCPETLTVTLSIF